MTKRERNRAITTTLPTSMLLELELAAKELGTTKRMVLIKAFIPWDKQHKQEMSAKSYELMKRRTAALEQHGTNT